MAEPFYRKSKSGTNNIRYAEQKEVLEKAKEIIPKGKKVLLQGDRFYGTTSLIGLCTEWKWGYRLRLKKNFIVKENKYRAKLNKKVRNVFLNDVLLGRKGMKISIGIVQENEYEEPW